MYLFTCVWGHVHRHTMAYRAAWGSQLSPSTIWALETELRPLGLVASTLIRWAIYWFKSRGSKKLNYSWAARVPMWWCDAMSHGSNVHTMKANKDDASIRHSFPVLSAVTAPCGAGCRTERVVQHRAEFPVQLSTQVLLSKMSATSRCQLRKHELKL